MKLLCLPGKRLQQGSFTLSSVSYQEGNLAAAWHCSAQKVM
jgi:hypothetical protein